jgi:hypothetical protein
MGSRDTDDALYPVCDGERYRAAALSAFTICVLAPGLFLGCWMLSLASLANNDIREEGTTSLRGGCYCRCCSCVFHGLRRKLYREDCVSSDEAFDYNGMEKGVATDGTIRLV